MPAVKGTVSLFIDVSPIGLQGSHKRVTPMSLASFGLPIASAHSAADIVHFTWPDVRLDICSAAQRECARSDRLRSAMHLLLANAIEKFSHYFVKDTVLALGGKLVPRGRHECDCLFIGWAGQLFRKFAVLLRKLSVLRY
jgi:hypothetical protein